MGTVDIIIYDNWFGFIYNVILGISSKIYWFLKGEDYAGAGVIFGICIILFFFYPTFKMLLNTGSLYSREGVAEGIVDYTNRIVKTDFFYKSFIAGIILILMFLEVDVRLLLNPKNTSQKIPVEVIEIAMEKTLGGDSNTEFMKRDRDPKTGEEFFVFKEPLIIGASVFFIDTVFQALILPLTHVFKISDDYVDSFRRINVDIFGVFTAGMLTASNQSDIFDNLAKQISLLPKLGHPRVFPKHIEKDYYLEDDTLIPKLKQTFTVPTKVGLGTKILSFFGFGSIPVDSTSLSPASASLYTILSKFNYLMVYDGGYNSIYDIGNNRNYKELFSDLASFLDSSEGNSDDPNSFIKTIKTNPKRLIVSKNIDTDSFNFNEYANLRNIMLTHPEVAELYAIVLSWYKHSPVESQELQERAQLYKRYCEWNTLVKQSEYNRVCKDAETVRLIQNSRENKSFKLYDMSNLFFWNATVDKYKKTMDTYFNKYLDKLQRARTLNANNDDFNEFNNFIETMFTKDGNESIYGIALQQILSGNTIHANLFNSWQDEQQFVSDYFKSIRDILNDQYKRLTGVNLSGILAGNNTAVQMSTPDCSQNGGIICTTERYVDLLSQLYTYIIQVQKVGDSEPIALTDNKGNTINVNVKLLQSIDSAGIDYLMQTISYWKQVNSVARIVSYNIARMLDYLNQLIALDDSVNSGNNVNNEDAQSYTVKKEDTFIPDSDNLFYYFMKLFADISDIDNEEHVSPAMFGTKAEYGHGLLESATVKIVKAFVWFLYFIVMTLTIFLLFYFLIQRLIAFTVYFTLWPVLFFKAAFLGSFKETLGGFFTSWASFRCFDFAFLIGFIFIKFMGYFTFSSSIYATRIYQNYGNEAIKTVNMFITVLSMLISILLIRFIYTRMVQLITNRFDVIADSLGRVADQAMAQAGAVASLGAAGMKMAGKVGGLMVGFIPVIGSLASTALNTAVDKGADIAQNVASKITNPIDGQK